VNIKSLLYMVNLMCILALVLSLGWIYIQPASAAAFVVNSSADDANAHDNMLGDGNCMDQLMRCTLRAAIEEANTLSGADTITFASMMNILLDSGEGNLPYLTEEVTIDASSVWDTTNNQPGVTLDGNSSNYCGFTLSADGCSIYGLYITNFGLYGIYIISGNSVIGGTGTGQRNVISGNGDAGVTISGNSAQYNIVQNNYIGTNPGGTLANPNNTGVLISDGAAYNTVGGSTASEGNVISGNTSYGVRIELSDSDGNGLGGNLIGVAADGSTPLGNGNNGVMVDNGPSGTYIGGGGALADNLIAHNPTAGIYIYDANSTSIERNTLTDNGIFGVCIRDGSYSYIADNTITANLRDGIKIDGSAATGNWISQNSIYDNTLQGINLEDGGNTALSAPVITSATSSGASGTAAGCSNCIIEIFSDADDEGQTYHGTVTADVSGNWSYSGALTGPYVTATATDASFNTSEFSAPYDLSPANQPPDTPGCPSPIDNDTQIATIPTLSWCGGDPDGDSVIYQVMGGVQGAQLAQWCGNISVTYCAPGTLQPGTTYEWQVTANDGINPLVSGPVWTFTTLSQTIDYEIYLPLTEKH
jgi:CSLREA domain-containing protein